MEMIGTDIPYMKTLSSCLDTMVSKGYTANFKATPEGLRSLDTDKLYTPEQIDIVNFYRFEGISNPDDNAILYIIETQDGSKGTLVDAYGAYADPAVAQFIVQVEAIKKKVTS